ncbi:hypothetical protein JT31_12690 [Cedecea neteri]|uniref:Uncharacterized protein n=1 Tax=Cedecea neteri TaxID=158822 RepID=A0A089PZH4_9ENTR|nr:hypothetical protein JT31_12690 [Cedecea neteri]
MPRFLFPATLNITVASRLTATPLFPALIAPGYDPTQAGLSCREQRKRAIVGNESGTTTNVWVIAGGFTALAAMSSPGAGAVRGMALSPGHVHRALKVQGKQISR